MLYYFMYCDVPLKKKYIFTSDSKYNSYFVIKKELKILINLYIIELAFITYFVVYIGVSI